MKADALGQFLVSKKWMRWVLVYGTNDPDRAFADAFAAWSK